MFLKTLQSSPENACVGRVYFRKAGHACGINKKDKFKDETPLNSIPILSFWSVKMPAKIETGHCVQVPTRKVSKISPGRSLFYKVAGL